MTEREIFLAAVEKDDPSERATYLDQVCGADAALRQRIEALLRSRMRAADFMEVPVLEQLATDGGGLDFLAPSQKPGSLGRLAHYEILEVVGRGGMGTVFRAFDEKLHRVVALKALAPQLATSSVARQRFVREARAAAAVTHDNVIAIHAVEDAGPVPYLVMRFVNGPTLQKKLDHTGPLSLKEILRIGLQTAEGLAAAHRQGLVHRDVKPANILLENGVERVRLTDFGLARAGDDASLTQSGVVAGTPMYMSPEQAQGEPVDFRSDLFSLGSVLYVMCTGHPPFRAPTSMAVLKRVCEETPRPIREINPELPPWLGDLLTRLHAKVPADRFASAQEVADLLARHLAELQHVATPPPPATPPARGTERLPLASWGERTELRSPPEPPREKSAAAAPRPRRRGLTAALILLALLAGLGLCEATGVTDVRGTVLRLFSSADRPVTEATRADNSKLPQTAKAPAAVPAPAGLVSWWRGEGNARDVRGNNHGTAVGNVSYASGQVGLAFKFDGFEQIEVAGSPDLSLTSAVTMEAWIKPIGLRPEKYYGTLIAKGSDTNRNYTLFLSPRRALHMSYYTTDKTNVLLETDNDLVPFEQFSHVAGVIDTTRGVMEIYHNGKLVATRPTPGPMVPNNLPLTIGRSDSAGVVFGFYGLIDEPAVYNRALSQAEIQSIVNAGTAGKRVPAAGEGQKAKAP
jgi:serine/threonine protein kinase